MLHSEILITLSVCLRVLSLAPKLIEDKHGEKTPRLEDLRDCFRLISFCFPPKMDAVNSCMIC